MLNIYLLSKLIEIQQSLDTALSAPQLNCPIDERYSDDWDAIRNYVDAAISNLQEAITYQAEGTLVTKGIITTMDVSSTSVDGLLSGYLKAMAQCPGCGEEQCDLKDRAQEAIKVREELLHGEYLQDQSNE